MQWFDEALGLVGVIRGKLAAAEHNLKVIQAGCEYPLTQPEREQLVRRLDQAWRRFETVARQLDAASLARIQTLPRLT
jgi:hypothetical protein